MKFFNRYFFLSVFLISWVSGSAVELRRPISPEKPLWIIHVDTWNTPDPERIIEMVPEDIRPYCVFSISLSATEAVCCDGFAVCDSWLKACAQKRVWSMVQCASGSHSKFSDHDLSVYEDYFRQYPNFIGWNFAEQFWGFGDVGQPSFLERLALFGEILKISQRYGGYLVVSFTQAYYSADMMPIAYMKRNPVVRQQLTEHPENFICCEKYTMANGFFDIESNCLGAYLGGYAGQYGIRFDACGWWTTDGDADPFVKASGAIPIMEHVMLTGETVIDGPETIPVEVSHEVSKSTTKDGYTRRNWDWFPHYVNINIDEFRKLLDGTVRILTREEVIDRTKICIQNDLYGQGYDDYLTPRTLFDGLYRQSYDRGGRANENPWLDNQWWLKSTGRYPAIPQVYDLLDEEAKQLTVVKKSEYDKRWPTVASKVTELNKLFPQEYTGDIYAAHAQNTWMTYNPYQYNDVTSGGTRTRTIATKRAKGEVPFQFNTAERIHMDFAPYGMAVMKEFSDSVMLYLTNYRNSVSRGVFTEYPNAVDTFRIYGTSVEPTLTWKERGSHRASAVNTSFADSVFEIIVSHNGPLELGVFCKGNATARQTEWTPAKIEMPATPPVYLGTQQYEAEFFDYKSVGSCNANAYYTAYKGYQGQGLVDMGTNTSAAIRDTVTVLHSGIYTLGVRYLAPKSNVTLLITVNGKKYPASFRKTSGNEWGIVSKEVEMKAGKNIVVIRYVSTAVQTIIDCITLDRKASNVYVFGDSTTVYQSAETGEYALDLFPESNDYSISWQQVEGQSTMWLRNQYAFATQGLTGPYFRATVIGSHLYFDQSADGNTWQLVNDSINTGCGRGGTCITWNGTMKVQDITYKAPSITLSCRELSSLSQVSGGTDIDHQSFTVKTTDLLGTLKVEADLPAFEVMVDSLTNPEEIKVSVQMSAEASIGYYEGNIQISSTYLPVRQVKVSGSVTPAAYSTGYNFESDVVRTMATNPPAIDITRGIGNACTAGVVNYTDAAGNGSKMLKIYSALSAHGTGALDLNKFTRKATDYSVTWRQVITGDINHKNGVVLRADTSMVANATKGYTPGMMAGYYFNVYNSGTSTTLRIYKSTASTSLSQVKSTGITLPVSARQSVWYRASVSGTNKVNLSLEYSLDGINWSEGTSMVDESGSFQSGATQFVWGLSSSQADFLIDDITFNGITYDEKILSGIESPLVVEGALPIRTEYYTLDGRRLPQEPSKGFWLRREFFSNGQVQVQKLWK